MGSIAIKNLLAHKRRLLGTCAAVLLGVAFLAGTLVLGDTMQSSFTQAIGDANAGTDAVVRGATTIGNDDNAQRRAIPASLAGELAQVGGVAVAEPSVEGLAQLTGADGKALGGNGPPTMGANWVPDDRLNPYHLVEGRAPGAGGEVVIDRGSATKGNLTVGSTTTVRTPQPLNVTIVGIAALDDQDSLGGVTYTFFTLPEAQQQLLGGRDELSAVLLRATDGTSADELVARISPLLPTGVQAITGAALTEEQIEDINADFLTFFERFLLVFTGIALLVATFTIYNTFSVILAQRTRESALLRALGASRGQVLRSVGVEALAIGLLASLGGLLAGIGLAAGLQAAMKAGGLGLPDGSLVVAPRSIIASLAMGLIVTLLASFAPAIRASRVPPLAALRDIALDNSGTTRWRPVLGGLAAGGGIALVLSGGLARVGLGAIACIVGIVVLGPVAARPAGQVLGAPFAALRGVTGRLARQNAVRNPRRTASTASALMVGVAVVTLFTVFAASVKTSIDETVSGSFGGDLVIESEAFGAIGISPELAPALDELPQVAAATGLGVGAVRVGSDDRSVTVADLALLGRLLDLDVTEGSLADVGDDGLAISRAQADDNGWAVGATVPVTFADDTTADLRVGAVYEEASLVGGILLPARQWAAHAAQPTDMVVLIELAPGTSMADGKAAVTGVATSFGAPAPLDRAEFVQSVAGEIDQFLAVVYVLLALSILIAVIGIANTLSLAIHERTRELGLLRAVGQTRRQLRAMVRAESVIIAVFGTLGGVGLGAFLSWGLVRAASGTDAQATFTAPVSQLAVVVVLGALAGYLAGVRPARRAAKLDVLGAITTD